jgi:extracellular factor (EF) 3-hydroxypalmitic acid methyl ester biosynthesis protein
VDSKLGRDAHDLFSRCFNQILPVAAALNEKNESALVGTLGDLSHSHADSLQELITNNAETSHRNELIRLLHSHDWHSEFLLKSAFIAHALKKPHGYPGDADLMEMICKNDDRGDTPFAIAKNRVYLDLPAASAVRARAEALTKYLANLPDGARVLNLACGPALEVEAFLKRFPQRNVKFLLLDHDTNTIDALKTSLKDSRCEVGVANAFEIAKGRASILVPRWASSPRINSQKDRRLAKVFGALKYRRLELTTLPQYDLVYSSGLYDYVKYTRGNLSRGSTGLTTKLFSFVRPGGELLIGNFRNTRTDNPHKASHMIMMDMYSDWRLIYRSDDEIGGFADGISRTSSSLDLLNERLSPITEGGVIGFLKINRLH